MGRKPHAKSAIREHGAQGDGKISFALKPEETAPQLMARLVKAIGARRIVDRDRFFYSPIGKTVYAYSVDPTDITRLIREDKQGKKARGRLVGGRFRVQQ